MSFGAPGYLALLILPVFALAATVVWLVWRRRVWAGFGEQPAPSAGRALAASTLLVLALVAAALAAGRPQFGRTNAMLDDRGIDLMIALDVSQSMFADDVQPSRIEDAQQEINGLLGRMRGDRAGLVLFAGEPLMRMPLTHDLAALQEVVAHSDEEARLVRSGSDVGGAIDVATALLREGDAETKVVLVVSDGEYFGQGASQAVLEAARSNVRVYTAGAGTAGGSPVLDFDPATSRFVPRIGENGSLVMTRLDAETLTAIAEAGNGRYVGLGDGNGSLAELANEFASLPQTRFGGETQDVLVERFQWFAATALALVLASVLVSGWGRIYVPVRRARLWPLLGASMFVAAICTTSVAQYNERGNRLYEQGDYGGALEQYRAAQSADPSRPEPYYNAGNALGRAGRYDEAVAEARRALNAEGGDALAPIVEYATGNHYASARQYDDAREAYKRSLLADPSDGDAKHNLEVVERLAAAPTPTPPAELPPDAPPSGGESGGPQGEPTPQTAGGQGSEDSSGEPGGSDAGSALSDALKGLDEEVTPEQARRILDLVERENERAIPRQSGSAGLPDY